MSDLSPRTRNLEWKHFHEALKFFRRKYVLNQKASLKYIGGDIRKVGTARWGKLFPRLQILSDSNLRFCVGGS